MKTDDRRGFTLVELLIVAVVGALVVGATYQVLVTNQRAYTVQGARIQNQQTMRAGLEILFAELREASTDGGDFIGIDADSVSLRTMRSFGLACDTARYADPVITTRRVGRWFEPGDSLVVFLDGNEATAADDQWRMVTAVAVDTTTTCTGADEAQDVSVLGLGLSDVVLPGAPIRTWERLTYGRMEIGGQPYLGRAEVGGSPEPLVGPLKSGSGTGVRFAYYDENGNVTADPGQVAQVEVKLATESGARNAQGDPVADSLTIRVNARN